MSENCCAQTLIVNQAGSANSRPGPRGPAGSTGADGEDGGAGTSAFTTTTDGFTMPAVNSSAEVEVENSAWIANGQIIYIEGAGYFSATVADSVLTVTNLGYSGNALGGASIAEGAAVSPSAPKGASAPDEVRGYILLKNERASGTAAGTFTSGDWRARLLNTIAKDTRSLVVALDSGTGIFTLKPGKYRIRAEVPANAVNRHKARLRNITTAANYYGTSEFTGDTGQTSSYITEYVDLGENTDFVIEHRCQTTKATTGMGVPASFDVNESYEWVEIVEQNQ